MQEQTIPERDPEDRGKGHQDAGTIPIVIVARDNLALTKLAVRSALAQDVPVEVLVVDNCSSDGTGPWLRTKRITTIAPDTQWSLAKCWNMALAGLWRGGFDRALVLNNDLEILPVTARYLSAWIDHRDSHGSPFTTCVSVDSQDQITDPQALSWSYHTREHPDFSCFMIHRDVTRKVGWFDESYFPAYCEDSDYHVRMFRAGVRAVCVDIPFLHHGAGTIKTAGPAEQARIRRGADANRERFRQEYGCLPGTPAYGALFTREIVNA